MQNITARRVAAALTRHAHNVMPPSQAAWGAAMEREAAYIADDGAALQWAIGCVAASYGERLRAEHYLLPLLARCYLASICIAYAIDRLADQPYQLLQCRILGNTHALNPPFPFSLPLASLFPGGGPLLCDYLMLGAPVWQWMLGLAAVPLFLFAALRLMQGRAAAFPAFVLATLSGAVMESRHYWYTILLPWRSQLQHAFFGGPYYRAIADMVHRALVDILFYVLFPLIIGTSIALLVHEDDARKPKF